MAIVNQSTLPNISLPVVGTDEYVMCRDGVNLLGVPVTDAANGMPVLKNTASPNTTTPVLHLSATGTEANLDVAVVAKGTGSFALDVADGVTTGGNKRGTNAVDLQKSRTANTQVASGNFSVLAGQNNTASGLNSVAIGLGCQATGTGSVAIGDTCTSSGGDSVVIGRSSTSTSADSVVLGAFGSSAVKGQVVLGHESNLLGAYQTTMTGLRQVTTGAGVVRATTDAAAAGTTNQVVLRNNSVFKIMGRAVAYDMTTLDAKEWEFSALIKRGANASATQQVGVPSVTSTFGDVATSAWTLTVGVDTTNGAVAVNVQGAGTNQIRWFVEVFSYETGI